jgi:hypothetical protein
MSSPNSPYGQPPTINAHFALLRWNQNSLEQLKTELLKAITEDPQISDPSNIGLDIEADGNTVTHITVVGTVKSELDRQRAQQIVEVNTQDEVSVKNELSVQ